MKEVKFVNDQLKKEHEDLNTALSEMKISQKEFDKKYENLIEKNKTEIRMKSSFFRFVFEYYKKFWKLSVPMLIIICLSVVCSVMLPLLTKQMTTDIFAGFEQTPVHDYWGLPWETTLGIAAGVVVFNMGLMFLSQYLGTILSNKIEIELRQKSLVALVQQDVSYYSDKKIGEILTKVISDTQIVGEQSSTVPTTIINTVLTIIATLSMMFYFDWKLTLVVIGVFLLIAILLSLSFGVVKKRIKKVRAVITEINGKVTDRINNVRLIKANGTEAYEEKKFVEVHKEYQKETNKMAKVSAIMVTTIFGGISLLQLAIVGASMLIYGNSPEAAVFFGTTFGSFTLAQGLLVGSMFQAVMVTVGLARAGVASERVNRTITEESILELHYTDGDMVESIEGKIEFKGVSFSYPEKPTKQILPKFDFTFEKGKSYAFVGETGSGKSTISKLILRYYDPTEGDIIIDGKYNLKDINLPSYLTNVGYVEQEPSILYGDIFENVKYGRFDATDEEVVEACKKAELHDLIQGWPEKYKTILGEHGMMLSGGQKQRLVIARMFLKDPQLLILDEATSALDNIVEKEIQEKLELLMEGRTTVSIAHRLSTIKNADKIIVLGANGKGIVQTGTFKELKDKPGHFQDLYNAGLMD